MSHPSHHLHSDPSMRTPQSLRYESPAGENDSDYGEFADNAEELEIVEQLLAQVNTQQEEPSSLLVTDIEDYEAPQGIYLPKILGLERKPLQSWTHNQIAYNDFQSKSNTEIRKENENREEDTGPRLVNPEPAKEPDTRSPLERFRRPPKKALSVTDLVSPSWCELQYYYVLSKHGRKRRTPAMKQGSAVHQALEDEVHITVPIAVEKKEDSWGLRIWNIIQGLRTLQDTGKTRELEVWGSIGGEIVNGVIDEVNFECPDPQFEAKMESRNAESLKTFNIPEYQRTITEYLISGAEVEQGQSMASALSNDKSSSQPNFTSRLQNSRQIYITDIKTRTSQTLPSGSSILPTIIQLHLYHHMLENLAQGNFSLDELANRYDFDINEPFSDAFIAQVGNLNQEALENAPLSQEVLPSQDSMDILLQHNSLAHLWDFMMHQFQQTFILPSPSTIPTSTPQSTADLPPPTTQPTRLSPILTAKYLSNARKGTSTTPEILGQKCFPLDPTFLTKYLYDTLSWWRGEREARGVEVNDAWKCRVCEFREGCEWIQTREEEMIRHAKERIKVREQLGKSRV